jgi:hypothetical protein
MVYNDGVIYTRVVQIYLLSGQEVFPLDQKGKKPFLALFLKTENQFSSSLIIYIQK